MEQLLKALINSLSENQFELVCDLRARLLKLQREELHSFQDNSQCISPNWDEMYSHETYSFEKTPSERTRDFLRYCKEKRNSEIRGKKKKGSKSILSVLERYGVRMKGKMILCPFHLERTPSCRIYFETNTFYCFGCGKYGTAEDLEEELGGKK